MKKILTTLIATTALLTLSAPASSAEITGCLDVRGTLTKVAPGVQPMRPCGPQAKKVRIPVASGAGKPGSARVDSYTFFAEVSTAGAQPGPGSGVTGEKLLFELKIGQDSLVSLWGQCVEFDGKNIAYFEGDTDVLRNVVVTSTGGATIPAGFFFFNMAEILQERPEFDHADLAAGVQIAHFIDSHIRVKIEAAATVDRGSPALCTFSGTVDIIRAR